MTVDFPTLYNDSSPHTTITSDPTPYTMAPHYTLQWCLTPHPIHWLLITLYNDVWHHTPYCDSSLHSTMTHHSLQRFWQLIMQWLLTCTWCITITLTCHIITMMHGTSSFYIDSWYHDHKMVQDLLLQ